MAMMWHTESTEPSKQTTQSNYIILKVPSDLFYTCFFPPKHKQNVLRLISAKHELGACKRLDVI